MLDSPKNCSFNSKFQDHALFLECFDNSVNGSSDRIFYITLLSLFFGSIIHPPHCVYIYVCTQVCSFCSSGQPICVHCKFIVKRVKFDTISQTFCYFCTLYYLCNYVVSTQYSVTKLLSQRRIRLYWQGHFAYCQILGRYHFQMSILYNFDALNI